MIKRYEEFILEREFNLFLNNIALLNESNDNDEYTFEWDLTNSSEKNNKNKLDSILSKLPKEKIKEYFYKFLSFVFSLPLRIRYKTLLTYIVIFLSYVSYNYLFNTDKKVIDVESNITFRDIEDAEKEVKGKLEDEYDYYDKDCTIDGEICDYLTSNNNSDYYKDVDELQVEQDDDADEEFKLNIMDDIFKFYKDPKESNPNRKSVIAVGQFKRPDYAINLIDSLFNDGYNVYLSLNPNNGLNTVGVQFVYDEKEDIETALEHVRSNINKDSWVLRDKTYDENTFKVDEFYNRGEYYVPQQDAYEAILIVGQFSNSIGVKSLIDKIVKLGYFPYSEINPKNGLTMVGSNFYYNTQKELADILNKFKVEFSEETWILKGSLSEYRKIQEEMRRDEIFKRCQEFVRQSEGGYSSDRNDSGNYVVLRDDDGRNEKKIFIGTNHGISAKTLMEYIGRVPTVEDMKSLPYEKALKIYKSQYWIPQNFHLLEDESIAMILYDGCVNQGVNGIRSIYRRAIKSVGIKINSNDNPYDEKFAKKVNRLSNKNKINLFNYIKNERIASYKKGNPIHIEGWLNRINKINYQV